MSNLFTFLTDVATFGISRKIRKSKTKQRRGQREYNLALSSQQAAVDIEQKKEEAARAATEEKAKKKMGSRLALISTTPRGILGNVPIGRAKVLGN